MTDQQMREDKKRQQEEEENKRDLRNKMLAAEKNKDVRVFI